MKITKFLLSLCSILFLTLSCHQDSEPPAGACGQNVIVSNFLYTYAPKSPVYITGMTISGDCLHISFAASGCSGDSWEMKLIASEMIMESYPPQINVRFSLKNEELCEAYISKEVTFDLTNLRTSGNKIILNMTNNGTHILYEY